MAGEYHLSEPHDVLTPIDDLVVVGTYSYETTRQDVEDHDGDSGPEDVSSADYLETRRSHLFHK